MIVSNKNSKMSFKEKKILIGVFIIVSIIFGTWKVFLWNNGYGDDAFLAQLTTNIASSGRPVTQSMSSIDIVLKEIVTLKSDVLCEKELKAPETLEINYFKQWHTYFILYLGAPLVALLGAPIVLSLVTVFSFFGLFLLVYLFLREKNIDIVPAISFVLFLSAHPAWSQSLQGQVYVDRFFIGLGFLLLFVMNKYPQKKTLILFISILCASISDRFGILVGGILIGNEVLYYNQKKSLNLFNIGVGFICALFSIYLVKFYVHHPHYGSFASSLTPNVFISNIKNPIFSENLIFFLTLNILIYGIFGGFSWRYFLMAIGLMIPNIFGNIGGAEKTGFLTHYHSTYLPMLMYAATDGFVRIYNGNYLSKFSQKFRIISSTVIMSLFAIGLIGSVDYNGNQFAFQWVKVKNSVLFVGSRDFYSFLFGEKKNQLETKLSILNYIPEGSSVATVESMMPIFSLKRELHLYPIGLDSVNYLVLPVINPGEADPIFGGATTYIAEEMEPLNRCFTKRIKESFDMDSMKIIGGFAILKRRN